jgi:endonuclease/exonuclease/phosphatase family metal-dependent hydrolase
MRIGTYNVQGLRGYPQAEASPILGEAEGDGAAAHFSGVLGALGCDILGLQEGPSHRQMQRIALAMQVNLATFPSPLRWPGQLLTRYPIRESRVFSHPTPSSEMEPFSRSAGAALLDLPDGSRLWVLLVHLHPRLPGLRVQEAEIVSVRAQRLLAEADHLVVLGDFNCEVHEAIHTQLQGLGLLNVMQAGGGLAPTRPSVGPAEHAIDHIYISASLQPSLTHAHVVRSVGFCSKETQREGLWVHSDHLPVIAELEIREWNIP